MSNDSVLLDAHKEFGMRGYPKRKDTKLDKVAAKWRERQERQNKLGIPVRILVGVIALAVPLSALYLLVRFVHWAWFH